MAGRTAEKKAKQNQRSNQPEITMYGRDLCDIEDIVWSYIKRARGASRPEIAHALAEHPKAPRWVGQLNDVQRFRIVRKLLDYWQKMDYVTSRLGRNVHGADVHIFKTKS